MVMAVAWYSSGTFWGAAGAIAVTVFGAIGIVAAWIRANPIQRLGYGMSQDPHLQVSRQAWSGDLRITWKDRPVTEPHIVDISLISHGRQDIRKQDFEDQPLEFRLEGGDILAILQTVNSPESAAVPSAVIENAVLKIGPSHITRRQSTKFTLLAEGTQPTLHTPSAALHNVDLVPLSAQPSHRPRFIFRLAVSVTAMGAGAALIVLGILIARPTTPANPAHATGIPTGVTAELQSPSSSSELNGITRLQALMQSSPGDQPAAIRELASFIRGKSPAGNNDQNVTTTIQLALNALRNRNPANDGSGGIVFDNTNLTGANLSGIDLSGASLVNTDFTSANLSNANLRNANLSYAYVGGAILIGASLDNATLTNASFYQTTMCNGSRPVHRAEGYNCQA